MPCIELTMHCLELIVPFTELIESCIEFMVHCFELSVLYRVDCDMFRAHDILL